MRVERTYICRRGDEARYRSELAVGNLLPSDGGSPAIDGLYIFPDPQEQASDSGFTAFRVTAYGRTNTTGKIDRQLEIKTAQIPTLIQFVPTDLTFRSALLTATIAINASTLSVVVPTSTDIGEINIPNADTSFTILSTSYEALVAQYRRQLPSARYSISGVADTISVTPELTSVSRNSYGFFDEISATISGIIVVKDFAVMTINNE